MSKEYYIEVLNGDTEEWDRERTVKVVINTCWGGFGLSEEALRLYRQEINNEEVEEWDIQRDDPILVEVVEEMGEKANTNYSDLQIVEIPADVQYTIEEYDGAEHIAEVHRTWRA